jgi:hypothetical protein
LVLLRDTKSILLFSNLLVRPSFPFAFLLKDTNKPCLFYLLKEKRKEKKGEQENKAHKKHKIRAALKVPRRFKPKE